MRKDRSDATAALGSRLQVVKKSLRTDRDSAGRNRRMLSHRGIRYLLAGACNTLFGICNTLAITRLFVVLVPSQPKLMGTAAMLFASFLSIAFSFLTYKWFVFKTRGNYLGEYLRSLLVYLPSIAINTLAVAPLRHRVKIN